MKTKPTKKPIVSNIIPLVETLQSMEIKITVVSLRKIHVTRKGKPHSFLDFGHFPGLLNAGEIKERIESLIRNAPGTTNYDGTLKFEVLKVSHV